MKKPLKPFTVAHKRRLQNVTIESTSIWSEETGRELRSLLDKEMASEQGADGTFECTTTLSQPSQLPKPNRSTGRILEPQTRAKALAASAVDETQMADRINAIETPTADAIENLAPEVCTEIPLTAEALKPSSVSVGQKPSYNERRRAIRKALPLGERWKRHLPHHGT